MSSDDLVIEILREIRDGIRTTNEKLDANHAELKAEIGQTNAEIGQTNARLDINNARLEVVETTLKDLAGQQLLLTRYVKNTFDRHDQAIDELRANQK